MLESNVKYRDQEKTAAFWVWSAGDRQEGAPVSQYPTSAQLSRWASTQLWMWKSHVYVTAAAGLWNLRHHTQELMLRNLQYWQRVRWLVTTMATLVRTKDEMIWEGGIQRHNFLMQRIAGVILLCMSTLIVMWNRQENCLGDIQQRRQTSRKHITERERDSSVSWPRERFQEQPGQLKSSSSPWGVLMISTGDPWPRFAF